MAAGDVTIKSDSGRAIRGFRHVTGTVVLDGGNPTPIALAAYFRECLGGVVSFRSTAALALDPSMVTCNPSGTTLNVYAWKVTGSGDATLIASTNAAVVVDFIAWGRR